MYIGICGAGKMESLSQARVDMNAAALLQQTTPYSSLRGRRSLLLPPLHAFSCICNTINTQLLRYHRYRYPRTVCQSIFFFFFKKREGGIFIQPGESETIDYKPREKRRIATVRLHKIIPVTISENQKFCKKLFL